MYNFNYSHLLMFLATLTIPVPSSTRTHSLPAPSMPYVTRPFSAASPSSATTWTIAEPTGAARSTTLTRYDARSKCGARSFWSSTVTVTMATAVRRRSGARSEAARL